MWPSCGRPALPAACRTATLRAYCSLQRLAFWREFPEGKPEPVRDAAGHARARPYPRRTGRPALMPRECRFASRGKGKSGCYRTVTYYGGGDVPVLMLALIDKASEPTCRTRSATDCVRISRHMPRVTETTSDAGTRGDIHNESHDAGHEKTGKQTQARRAQRPSWAGGSL